MVAAADFIVTVREDSDFLILGRLTSADGAGAVSPVAKEGRLLKQADVSSITAKTFDDSGTELTTGSVTVANVIYDTLQTEEIWLNLPQGGNFKHSVPAAWVGTGDKRIWIEYKFTLAGGTVFFIRGEINVENIFTS